MNAVTSVLRTCARVFCLHRRCRRAYHDAPSTVHVLLRTLYMGVCVNNSIRGNLALSSLHLPLVKHLKQPIGVDKSHLDRDPRDSAQCLAMLRRVEKQKQNDLAVLRSRVNHKRPRGKQRDMGEKGYM